MNNGSEFLILHLPPLDGGVLEYVTTKQTKEKGKHRDVSDYMNSQLSVN